MMMMMRIIRLKAPAIVHGDNYNCILSVTLVHCVDFPKITVNANWQVSCSGVVLKDSKIFSALSFHNVDIKSLQWSATVALGKISKINLFLCKSKVKRYGGWGQGGRCFQTGFTVLFVVYSFHS